MDFKAYMKGVVLCLQKLLFTGVFLYVCQPPLSSATSGLESTRVRPLTSHPPSAHCRLHSTGNNCVSTGSVHEEGKQTSAMHSAVADTY